MNAGSQRLRYVRLAVIVIAMSAVGISSTWATEPEGPRGYITLGRDVPAHNAFREGDVGQPVNAATAREDVVIAGTRTSNQIPQSLPDAALDRVGAMTAERTATPLQANGIGSANISTHAGSVIRGANAGIAQAAASIEFGVMPAISAGGGGRSLPSVGHVLSGMQGAK